MSARCVRLLTFPENLPARNSRIHRAPPASPFPIASMDGHPTEIDAAIASMVLHLPSYTYNSSISRGFAASFRQEAVGLPTYTPNCVTYCLLAV